MVPDRAMDRAARCDSCLGEHSLDLLVGAVEGAGGAGFLFALAAQLQGRLDEVVGLRAMCGGAAG